VRSYFETPPRGTTAEKYGLAEGVFGRAGELVKFYAAGFGPLWAGFRCFEQKAAGERKAKDWVAGGLEFELMVEFA
jgi:hypothetical protein